MLGHWWYSKLHAILKIFYILHIYNIIEPKIPSILFVYNVLVEFLDRRYLFGHLDKIFINRACFFIRTKSCSVISNLYVSKTLNFNFLQKFQKLLVKIFGWSMINTNIVHMFMYICSKQFVTNCLYAIIYKVLKVYVIIIQSETAEMDHSI